MKVVLKLLEGKVTKGSAASGTPIYPFRATAAIKPGKS